MGEKRWGPKTIALLPHHCHGPGINYNFFPKIIEEVIHATFSNSGLNFLYK